MLQDAEVILYLFRLWAKASMQIFTLFFSFAINLPSIHCLVCVALLLIQRRAYIHTRELCGTISSSAAEQLHRSRWRLSAFLKNTPRVPCLFFVFFLGNNNCWLSPTNIQPSPSKFTFSPQSQAANVWPYTPDGLFHKSAEMTSQIHLGESSQVCMGGGWGGGGWNQKIIRWMFCLVTFKTNVLITCRASYQKCKASYWPFAKPLP